MEVKSNRLSVKLFSIVLASLIFLGAIPMLVLANPQEVGVTVPLESGSTVQYDLAVTEITASIESDDNSIAMSPIPIVPLSVIEDIYADSAVDQASAPVGSVIGAPDDVRYALATNLYYARASGSNWGSGSGSIISVEIAAEWSSSGLIDDGAILRYYDDSLAGYGSTLTPTISTNYATDNTLYLDITVDKPSWTWADIANIHPEVSFFKAGGPDGGSLFIDAIWIRVVYESVQIEYNIPVSAGWNLISLPPA